jgi:gliding motility-associated-like protein
MTYLWTGLGILSGATTENPTVNLAGLYQLVVTNPDNGCTAISQVQVDENKTLPDVDAGLDQAFSCGADTLTLTGSSNTPFALFSWQAVSGSILAGATSNTVTIAALDGRYILRVTNPSNGCSQVDTVLVRSIQPLFPVPTVVLPACETPLGLVQFEGGDGSFTYSINGGITFSADSVFTDLAPGTYQLVIQSSEGCEDSTQIVLPTIANVSIQLPAAVQIELGNEVLLQPLLNLPSSSLATIEWTPSAGLSCTDCLTPLASPVTTTAYQLLAGSTDGCFDTAQLIVQVRTAGDIYVPTIFHAGGPWENATFYPHTELTVTSYQLQIFDRWGGLMYLTNEVIRGWDGKANGKWQEPGVYTYLIEMEVVNRAGKREERVLVGDVTLIR